MTIERVAAAPTAPAMIADGRLTDAKTDHRPRCWRRADGAADAPTPTAGPEPTAAARGRGVPHLAAGRAGPVGRHARGLPARPARATCAWLRERGRRSATVTEADVAAYVAAPPGRGLAPASVTRALVAVRSLHRFLAAEGAADADPGADVEAPRGARGACPRRSREDEVGRLLDAAGRRRPGRPPRPGHPRGALRHRAAHLRAGRPVARRRRPRRRAAPGLRQGEQGAGRARSGGSRSEPWRTGSGPAAARELAPAQWARRGDAEAVFLNPRGGRLTRQGAWGVVRRHGADGRASAAGSRPHVLRHSLRHPHARPRRRHPRRAGAARPRLDQHDAGVHAGVDRAAVGGVPDGPPPGTSSGR